MSGAKIQPVVLSGGSGSRLWPASRSMYPKQLLPLVSGDSTMLQDTVSRLDGLPGLAEEYLVVCNEAHRFMVAEQLRQIGAPTTIVLEPEGRNTAPAVALAAFFVVSGGSDPILLVTPADHVMRDIDAFQEAVCHGLEAAAEGKLVTFGVAPTAAETGYGYIKARPDGNSAVPVAEFVEKPSPEKARAYLSDGLHFWNSGIFLFKASAYLSALREFEPEIYAACESSVERRVNGEDFVRPDSHAFLLSPSNSIDYAVMERTDKAMMVPLNAGWSDVGSWATLHEYRSQDEAGNTADGDVVMMDCRDSFVSAGSRLVAAVGLDNMVVIETGDSTLVARKDRSQDVKAIVDKLAAEGRGEARLHRQVFRPWGSYDSLESKPGFQVKRLVVNPGAVLSLQKHAHRAEHWVVVHGKARITKNDEVFDLEPNESTYIAVGDVHRIANPFDEPVQIIEVQCGEYLGEDDIVRIDDEYGRAGTIT